MAEISRNSKDNWLDIFRGFHQDRYAENYHYVKFENSDIALIKNKNKIIGTRQYHIFEDLEILSYYAENELHNFFLKQGISSLYLGNMVQTKDLNPDFNLELGKTRPDFLLRSSGLGTFFVDCKCRRKIKHKGSHYFILNIKEIENLAQIQEQMQLPLWVAIVERDTFKKQMKLNKFWLVSIEFLKLYKIAFLQKVKKFGKLSNSIYISKDLLVEQQDVLQLSSDTRINKKTIQKAVLATIENSCKIQDVILQLIREENIYKSYLSSLLIGSFKHQSIFNGYFVDYTHDDINKELLYLIKKGKIKYEKGKHLSLENC